MNGKHLALFGLKYDPFSPEIPTEALYVTSRVESFLWRIEQHQVRTGGFALVDGDPGMGKSAVLRLVAARLSTLSEVTVGELEHPQSNVADFYRELGDIFGV
jgi:type II secretory pathway predicted ATPase ExeA